MMMVNFRLFAGLMSLESILCLDHFCSRGPDGILLSRTMDMVGRGWKEEGKGFSASKAAENGDRDGNEAEPDEEAEGDGELVDESGGFLGTQAESLENGTDAVAQVRAEQGHGDDVEERNIPSLWRETVDHHLPGVV